VDRLTPAQHWISRGEVRGQLRPNASNCSTSSSVTGCYVHRLFDSGSARAALLGELGVASRAIDHRIAVDAALDQIAAALETHLDIAALARLAGLEDFAA
jgi:cobyric acid synthase